MIELILETLAEFGLIHADYKHRKNISKKEKVDGKKRTFQKYFLQPSSIAVVIVVIITSFAAFFYFTYQRTSVFPEKTKSEIIEMSKRAEKWREKFGRYPTDLNELISNSPIRKSWKLDAWGKPYHYSIIEDGQKLLITSSGSDKEFGTNDDIISN